MGKGGTFSRACGKNKLVHGEEPASGGNPSIGNR